MAEFTSEANARLIENAPAMYKLLNHIKHELREYGNSDWDGDLCFDIDMLLDKINSPTLKPCPFCSNSNAYVADYSEKFAVECPNCDCSTRLCDTKEEAVDAWNMRDGNIERTGNDDE